MKFMLMHKMTPEMEKGLPPSPEEMAAIGQVMGAAVQSGAMLSGEGLRPSAERFLVAYRDGERTITPGPFPGAKELAGGYFLLRVTSREDALVWLDRVAEAVGDIQLLLGPVNEFWDLGMGEKPADAPCRFLVVYGSDPQTGEFSPRPGARKSLDAVILAMKDAGVLQEATTLAATKHGARIRYSGKKATFTDGPFAESKELIAGYAIFELASKEEAVRWATQFGDVVGVEELDVRLIEGEIVRG